MKVVRVVIIVVFFIVGIGCITYPLYNKNKTAKEQDKMIKELENKIKNNESKNSKNNKEKAPYDSKLVQEEVKKLEIEENDGDINEGDTKQLLKEQTVIGMIDIPSIGIKYAIVEGSNRANIAVAIGHMKGTSMLGGEGNCVLAGHNGGIYGKFFKDLNKLKIKDLIEVTDEYGDKYVYEVYKIFKVKPTDIYVTDNLEGYNITLITCQDNGKNRLIVRGKLKE